MRPDEHDRELARVRGGDAPLPRHRLERRRSGRRHGSGLAGLSPSRTTCNMPARRRGSGSASNSEPQSEPQSVPHAEPHARTDLQPPGRTLPGHAGRRAGAPPATRSTPMARDLADYLSGTCGRAGLDATRGPPGRHPGLPGEPRRTRAQDLVGGPATVRGAPVPQVPLRWKAMRRPTRAASTSGPEARARPAQSHVRRRRSTD